MRRNLVFFMGIMLLVAMIAACSNGGGGSTSTVVTIETNPATGATTEAKTATVGGSTVTIPQGTIFRDSTGNLLTGTLTVTITENSYQTSAPAGANAGAFTKVTITSASGAVAAKAAVNASKSADLNTPLQASLTVTGVTAASLPVYSSSNGTTWTSEGKEATVSSGKATFTITSLTRPYWGVFQIVLATASYNVSGTVANTSATATKAALITDGVAVQITSFDVSGTKLGESAVTSDVAGGFSSQIMMSGNGGYLIVTATKEGFTQFQKRIEYKSPRNIELQAVLEAVNVAFSAPGSALKSGADSSGGLSFSFAVVRFSNGVKKAVSGTALTAAKAAGATTELSIDIPATSVPGVNRLKGELNTYEPATQSDRFPGSYSGVDASGNEGKMISLAFDSMKISDADTGKNLGEVAKALVKSGVRKAADKSTTITRYIYSSSCDNLFIEDYNKTLAGHQVPVWTLNPNTGKWIFIGEGTVVDANGEVIATPTAASCKSTASYNLKILISNEEFAKYWWNLDHIVFDTPTEVCVEGTFSFNNGDPLGGLSLSLYGGNIDGTWGNTGSDGSYKLSTVLLNKTGSKAAKISYYDENGGYLEQAVTLASPCATYSKTDIAKPCEVSGKLVDDQGTGVAYRSISLQGSSFYRGVGTDANGAFSSLVKCNADINVFAGKETSSAVFNVNQAVGTDETSDTGVKVVLKDIVAPNIVPNGYGYFNNRSIKAGTTLSAFLSAYDEDGNYPIAWTLAIGTAATKTGSISATTSQPVQSDITGLAAGDYTATLKVKDSRGAERSLNLGNVTVSDGSRPPVVTVTADRNYVSKCSQTQTFNLYGRAYDPDGDTLSGAWSPVNCAGGAGTNGTISSTCQATLPADAVVGTAYTYTYTVTDNSTSPKSGSNNVKIWAQNGTPYTSVLSSDKNVVADGSTGTARNVILTAGASDPDGDVITGKWYVDGAAIAGCSDVTGTGSINNATCTYTIPSSAVLGQTFSFRFTPSDCAGNGTSRETKVSYGQAGDVTVVIQ